MQLGEPFKSISSRIAAISLLLNAVVLLAVGLYLSTSYRSDIADRFDRQLEIYGTAILTDIADNLPKQQGDLLVRAPDPRFQTPLSGWYWQLSQNGAMVMTSRSLFGSTLNVENLSLPEAPQQVFRNIIGPDGEDLRLAARAVSFSDLPGDFIFMISGDFTITRSASMRFQRNTLTSLAFIGALMSLATFALVRWGLTPLRLVGMRLADIREGRSQRLGGGFAKEIAPLAYEVDALLDYNEKLVERAQRHVGNLAHGLKTPLAVLANYAREQPDNGLLLNETQNMQKQIEHHLARARFAATSEILRPSVDVVPAFDRLVRTLKKIYADKHIEFIRDDVLLLKGDVSDFEDMLGNMLDNACKWAKSTVKVSALYAERNQQCVLELTVEDDGPGLSEQQKQQALKRGVKLDEMVHGSGLGLSIITDLADLYNATFLLLDSTQGGLVAKLILPAAKAAKNS